MLRNVLVVVSAAAVALAAVEFGLGRRGPWLVLAAYACVVLVAVLLERPRYRAAVGDGGAWRATGERFIDPASGEMTDVFEKPETGERQYRRAAAPGEKTSESMGRGRGSSP